MLHQRAEILLVPDGVLVDFDGRPLRAKEIRKSKRHCGGFALVRTASGTVTCATVNAGACRSGKGLCGCTCFGCLAARRCEHRETAVTMGSSTPLFPGHRFEFGHGRARRADGTDYVGPTMTVRPRAPDETEPKVEYFHYESCVSCGLRVRPL